MRVEARVAFFYLSGGRPVGAGRGGDWREGRGEERGGRGDGSGGVLRRR